MYRTSVLRMTMVLCAAWLSGVALAPASEKPAAPAHMPLVLELGASSYAQRERAASKLIALGMAAKPALLHGMEQDDLEIRLAAHRVLVRVMQSAFDRRIETFLNGTEAEADDVPGWNPFREVVGDSAPTRRLFADMLRAENDLLVALDQNDTQLEQKLVDRVQYLTSSQAIINGQRPTLTASTLATILLVGVHAQKTPKAGNSASAFSFSLTTSRIYSILSYNVSTQKVLQEAYSPQVSKLLSSWVDGIGNSQEQYGWSYAIQLALRFNLREQGLRIARQILEDPGTSPNAVPNAATVLVRFGTVADAKLLEPYLGNTQVFHTWSNAQLKKEPIRIQVRDAVLAMLIRLHGEDPASYGFNLLLPDENTIYKPYSLGFLEDAEREKALAKWKARVTPDNTEVQDQLDGEASPKADDQRAADGS